MYGIFPYMKNIKINHSWMVNIRPRPKDGKGIPIKINMILGASILMVESTVNFRGSTQDRAQHQGALLERTTPTWYLMT